MLRQAEAPDFYDYPPCPLRAVTVDGNTVILRWGDHKGHLSATWLRENTVGHGVDPVTREGIADPAELRRHRVTKLEVVDGDLEVRWDDGLTYRFPSGWLHSFVAGDQLTDAGLPDPIPWVTTAAPDHMEGERRTDLPTFVWPTTPSGTELLALLTQLMAFGAIRLTDGPVDHDALEGFVRRIAHLRDTNFGHVWDVVAKVDPDSTAYTGRSLVPHTDLPSRENPPGFQALHCVENSCVGGLNQISDALAIVGYLADHEPEIHDALTTLNWIFQSKGKDIDHRWRGPIVDVGSDGSLVIRGFSPVRAYPDMDPEDVDRSYDAIARFHELGADPAFQIESSFQPGDAVIFDNRRMLHARSAYDPTAGTRHLRGCYFELDDVRSTMRVLTRTLRR
ncbi:MAG: gamma-butyrobetaine,2-oxoglutarate dioxygenase [Acidimicrobiales bacterium]|nr:gamma-butyrobetaine,2-oxoglutarate dioxygenase [Acidimicrobiales bacterium]